MKVTFPENDSVRETDSFFERVEHKRAGLRSSEMKVAEYISLSPGDIAHLSISELARRTNTSEATVNRFSRSLGYGGYPDMKIHLLQAVMRERIKNIPKEINEGDDAATVARKLADSLVGAITETVDTVDFAQVNRAVESMMKADRIYFYGIGGSGHVADLAHHLFLKAGVVSTAYSDGYMQAVSAALVTRRDVVIGISHSGNTVDVIKVLQLARSRGATTIALTGNANAKIMDHADISLVTVSHEEPIYGDFMEAKVCQLFVIDLLYIAILLRDVPVFTRNLQATADAIWDRSIPLDDRAS